MLGYWSVLPAASWTMKCKNQWQVCTSLHTDTHVVGYYTFVILVLLCQIDHLENQEAEKNLGIDNCRILNGTVRRIIRLICFHFHFDFFVPRMRMPSRATALSSTVTNRGFKLMIYYSRHYCNHLDFLLYSPIKWNSHSTFSILFPKKNFVLRFC